MSKNLRQNYIQNQGNAIVLNRMYVGDYLSSNLGHEVINMYTADNDKHYLYLNAYGSFAQKWQGKIGYMLLTKYHSQDCVEIIGKAIGLRDLFDYKNDEGNWTDKHEISSSQREIIKDIRYGGISIENLFSDSERQNVFVTFEATKVYTVAKNKKLYIHFFPQKRNEAQSHHKSIILKSKDQIDIYLGNTKLALASLNQFFDNEESDDYKNLWPIIDINTNEHLDFWQELGVDDKVNLGSEIKPRQESLFDICQIQNSENHFSNALAYFMTRDRYNTLWNKFFANYDITLGDKYTISREESAKIPTNENSGGRIDLLIRTKTDLIVIENKIKSDINSIVNDGEGKQLARYYNYVNWLSNQNNSANFGKGTKFIILTPDYNIPTIEDEKMRKEYKIITYRELYDFLSKNICEIKNDANFSAFHEAMYRHTHENVNDYLYYEMQEKFYRRIKGNLNY